METRKKDNDGMMILIVTVIVAMVAAIWWMGATIWWYDSPPAPKYVAPTTYPLVQPQPNFGASYQRQLSADAERRARVMDTARSMGWFAPPVVQQQPARQPVLQDPPVPLRDIQLDLWRDCYPNRRVHEIREIVSPHSQRYE